MENKSQATVDTIANTLRKTWDAWNIRGVILISLGFQIFLILFSPLRKRTNKVILTFSLWSAYLLADYSANFCVGLIFDKRKDFSSTEGKDYIIVFWAPFLLLHLGGQDTITAFAIADNQLWLRHFLSLVFQLVTTLYVFLPTIPDNPLGLPTALVFFAGVIKYIERTCSLYKASMDTFQKSLVVLKRRRGNPVPATTLNVVEHDDARHPGDPVPVTTLNIVRHDDQQIVADHVDFVRKGYEYYTKFKGLVVDKTYNFLERDESRQYFLDRTPEDALTIIEVELNFIYEYFFTKAFVLRTQVGYVCRLASFSSILAALLIFFFDNKHGFNKVDVKITYVLLVGAVGLDFVAFLMIILSDYWVAIGVNLLIKHFLSLRKPKWSKCKQKPYTKFYALSKNPLFRRWSGTISGHDLIIYWAHIEEQNFGMDYLFDVLEYFGAKELVEKWRFEASNPFLKELWEFIFSELKRKSGVAEYQKKFRTLCESKGAWSIQESELEETERGELMLYVNSNEVPFDETLIVWHIATTLCYHVDDPSDHYALNAINDHRCFSKVLSDYMLYLLSLEPSIMSAVAGIGQQRILEIISSLKDLSTEAVRRLRFYPDTTKYPRFFCLALLSRSENIKDTIKLSMLYNAVALAKKLRALQEEKRWKIIAQVWVEMLSYAAINCRPDTFVQQLTKGGQLISFVWLSMFHLGLGTRQFKMPSAVKDEDQQEIQISVEGDRLEIPISEERDEQENK